MPSMRGIFQVGHDDDSGRPLAHDVEPFETIGCALGTEAPGRDQLG